MDPDRDVADLELFLAERGEPLLRAAVLLTGSQAAGEDLLQAALERLFRHWRKIKGDPEGYLRRTLYNLAADGWRRQGNWRAKLSLLRHSATEATPDGTAEVDRRDELMRLLLQLPPKQRAVIVLRYWEEMSEAEAAAVLGCSVGTIKSATSRGLSRLRELGSSSDIPRSGDHEGSGPETGRTRTGRRETNGANAAPSKGSAAFALTKGRKS